MSIGLVLTLLAAAAGQITAPSKIAPRIPSPQPLPPSNQIPSNLAPRAILRGVKLSYTCPIKTTASAGNTSGGPTVLDSVATLTLAPQQTDTAHGATPVTYDPIKVKNVDSLSDGKLYVFGPAGPDGLSPIIAPPTPVFPASSGSGAALSGLSSFNESNNAGLNSKFTWIERPKVSLATGEIRWTFVDKTNGRRFEARGRCV